MGYSKSTIKGISWLGILRIFSRIISIARTSILARILTPAQFGSFSIVSIVLAFTEMITETGVNVFLLQEKVNISKYINTAWVVSIARGTLISLIIVFAAPLISNFFSNSNTFHLLLLASLVPFLRGFINPRVVIFQKELQFHKEFTFRGTLFLVESASSVYFALITHDPISLVLGLIIGVILEVLGSFLFFRPIPKLKLNSLYLRKIIRVGKWVTVSGVFNYLFHNTDNIVIGKILGTSALGLYDLTYRISVLPVTEATEVVSKVTLPVFAKISDDTERLKRGYLKILLFIVLLLVPFGILCFFFSEFITNTILGSKWSGASSVFQVLIIFGVLRAISNSATTVFFAIKRQDINAFYNSISFLVLLLLIIPLVHKFGTIGAAYSALISTIFTIPVVLYYFLKLNRLRITGER